MCKWILCVKLCIGELESCVQGKVVCGYNPEWEGVGDGSHERTEAKTDCQWGRRPADTLPPGRGLGPSPQAGALLGQGCWPSHCDCMEGAFSQEVQPGLCAGAVSSPGMPWTTQGGILYITQSDFLLVLKAPVDFSQWWGLFFCGTVIWSTVVKDPELTIPVNFVLFTFLLVFPI